MMGCISMLAALVGVSLRVTVKYHFGRPLAMSRMSLPLMGQAYLLIGHLPPLDIGGGHVQAGPPACLFQAFQVGPGLCSRPGPEMAAIVWRELFYPDLSAQEAHALVDARFAHTAT